MALEDDFLFALDFVSLQYAKGYFLTDSDRLGAEHRFGAGLLRAPASLHKQQTTTWEQFSWKQ